MSLQWLQIGHIPEKTGTWCKDTVGLMDSKHPFNHTRGFQFQISTFLALAWRLYGCTKSPIQGFKPIFLFDPFHSGLSEWWMRANPELLSKLDHKLGCFRSEVLLNYVQQHRKPTGISWPIKQLLMAQDTSRIQASICLPFKKNQNELVFSLTVKFHGKRRLCEICPGAWDSSGARSHPEQ